LYYIAILDNDSQVRTSLREKCSKLLTARNIDAQVEAFSDTASFLARSREGIPFSLLFLDILLDAENGYLFAKELRRLDQTIDLVFITTTEDYAVTGYDVAPLLYLLKPLGDEQLSYAFDLFFKKHAPARLLLNVSGEIFPLNIHDILYCEVYGHTLSVHLSDGSIRELRYSINRLEQQLPENLFVRSHQSYLVNMSHIERIVRYELTLSNGQKLPISQSRYMELQNRFLQYCSYQKIRV
jgi:DNA-binding LytR/AlgR family response regulator